MSLAAKEEMLSPSSDPCVFFPLAADPAELETRFGETSQLRKNSRQGFARKTLALHQGSVWTNSGTALGIEPLLRREALRSRCTGKEHDYESGLDNFDARYYSSSLGHFTSPDWSDSPDPAPYATFTNPQTLDLYSYVKNNPLRDADPTGHSGDDDLVDHILNFVVSAGVTWLSDNVFGAGRPDPKSIEGQIGQSVGDFAAQQTGLAEAEAGTAGMADAGAMVTVPEVGPEGAALDAGISGVAILHGTATAALATSNMAKDINRTSSGPKANDAPGVTAGGQATDEHGNKLGPSGEKQVNTTSSNTREAARNRARSEGSGTTEHRNPRRGKPHFHPTDNKGKKKPSSTHHEYPG
jgi:RHS repeat-associated protein